MHGKEDPGEVPAPAEKPPPGPARPIRLAYLVSHPIQYQAPLLRLIAAHPEVDLTVFFRSDLSLRRHMDPGLGQEIEWDVPLVEGYAHRFLPAIGGTDRITFYRPFNHGMHKALKNGQFDVLWVHGYAIWFNLLALISARSLGIRTLVRDEVTDISKPRSGIKTLLKKLFFRLHDRLTDGYLAIGSLNRAYYRSQGIDAEKIFSVGYCVDNDHFSRAAEAARPERERLRAELGLEAGRPVILYMSKLTRRKRADDLLEAFATLTRRPRPYLLIAGSGELETTLAERARQIDGDAVRLLGFRNQRELPALYDLADLFVLPSEHEPWGLVVNEAMASGCPVAVSDHVGAAADLVRHGENGFIFPVGDRAALADVLAEAIGDPERLAGMRPAARETMAGWSFDQNLCGLLAALRQVTGRSEARLERGGT